MSWSCMGCGGARNIGEWSRPCPPCLLKPGEMLVECCHETRPVVVSRSERGGVDISIAEATARYESWLAAQISIIGSDLEQKHHAMTAGSFPFLRATYYRWAARWRAIVGDAAEAPRALAVGDIHGVGDCERAPRHLRRADAARRPAAPEQALAVRSRKPDGRRGGRGLARVAQ